MVHVTSSTIPICLQISYACILLPHHVSVYSRCFNILYYNNIVHSILLYVLLQKHYLIFIYIIYVEQVDRQHVSIGTVFTLLSSAC